NAITITPASAGVLRIAGDPVSAPATPTHVNNADFMDFTLSSVTGINIQYLNGNDRVTMRGFSVPGDISVSAGSGSDTFSLDTVMASHVKVAYQLALTLGGGINNVSADHVTCLFGFIDGGEPNSGSNLYFDGGDNVGYYITHFVGH